MSYYTYVPAKAATAPAPEAPKAPKYYHDYSKPAAPAAAPAPEPAKPHPYPHDLFGPIRWGPIPISSAYHPNPQLTYPAPVATAPAPAPIHNPHPGPTRAQIDAENLAIAHRTNATKPVQLVPYNPSPDQQFWCRELDSSYTLRTSKEVVEECQPGYWQYAQGGYPYWVRGEGK